MVQDLDQFMNAINRIFNIFTVNIITGPATSTVDEVRTHTELQETHKLIEYVAEKRKT
jgi:hypothetical protein